MRLRMGSEDYTGLLRPYTLVNSGQMMNPPDVKASLIEVPRRLAIVLQNACNRVPDVVPTYLQ
jgi:hypothetical protein